MRIDGLISINTIKTQFTNRIKYHIITAMELFKELVTFESVKRDLVVKGKVSKYMKDKATKSNRLEDIGGGSFSFENELINTNELIH